MRGGRGWHGGISMNDEKDGIVEKACTVWSALGWELRLCPEITKVIRTITESTVQRNFCYSQCKHKGILWKNYFQCTEKVDGYPLDCKYRFKRLRTFVTWNFQSAISRSTIWVWRVEYQKFTLNFFVIRGDMCPNGFYGQKKRSQSAQCAVAISNIDMFQDYVIFGVVSFH